MSHSEIILRSPSLSAGMKLTTLKRMAELSDDEDSSPSKYRKFSTEQKIIKAKSKHNLSSSSSSNEGSDDSSESDMVTKECTHSSYLSNGADHLNRDEVNETSRLQQLYKNTGILESDSNEFVVSPSRNQNSDQPPSANENSSVVKKQNIDVSDGTSNENIQELIKSKSKVHCAEKNARPMNDDHILALPGQNGNINLGKTNTIDIDSQYESEVIIAAENSNQLDVEPRTSIAVNQIEHSYQAPVISDAAVQLNIPQADSDSNLSQSIWILREEIISLKQTIHELILKVEKQENILGAVVGAQELNLAPFIVPAFHEKYNLRIPFSRIEDFAEFNQKLLGDMSFCNEFIMSLRAFIDNNVTLAKNILTMLRKYMSKDLVILFTASKSTGTKHVLKDTCFCKCLLQTTRLTIRNGLLPLEHEKLFYKNLSLVVSGAKGWTSHDYARRNYNEE